MAKKYDYDFSGYATKNDLKCADGRTIRKDAFVDNDGQTVPLVWQHLHNDPANVLGHALLENRSDGVYAYGKFNDTYAGKNAKMLVANGDVKALSIYANGLKQHGGDVLHGQIRELSLVLSGANPGAYIDSVVVEHSEEPSEDEAVIYLGDEDCLMHYGCEDDDDEKKKDTELEHAVEGAEELKPEAKSVENKPDVIKEEPKMAEKTVKDVFDELTEEQKNVVYFMIGKALEDAGVSGDNNGGEDMKHNVFSDGDYMTGADDNTISLSHSDMEELLTSASKNRTSLKAVIEERYGTSEIMHTLPEYGVENIDYLFPEARMYGNPDFIKRDDTWVKDVMSGAGKSPYSRVKSVHANITIEEARAKGYIKGKKKLDEVFTLLKRTTTPTTVYKKQKIDRDDIVDITDLDVVAMIKGEMRGMLEEEIARAIMVGDGRNTSDEDHIGTDHIRPIWTDDDLYTIKTNVAEGTTTSDTAKAVIEAAIRARKYYKGSGNPMMFTTEDMLADMLLIKDGIGHDLYPDVSALAKKLRVSKIATVPVFENQTDANGNDLAAIIVNMKDYNIGSDKGGAVNMFDDFDIDYNQYKYLIETRCSGALIKPYSAIAIGITPAEETGGEGDEEDDDETPEVVPET